MAEEIADVAEVVYYVEDSSSPLTVVKPAAFAPNDVLVLIIAQDAPGGGLASLTGPPGWTDKGNYDDPGGNSAGRVWVHPYDAADPGTWDFGYDAGAALAAALLRVVGADTTPIVTLASHVGAQVSGTVDSPSVTPTGINDLLVCVLAAVCSGNAFSETDPSGMTNRGQVQLLDLYMAVAVATRQLTDGNATGAKSWTAVSPSNSSGGTFSLAIKSSGFLDPDPPPNPPPPLVPPWLLRELVGRRQQPVRGDQYTPVVKEKLSGGASAANVTLTTSATTVAGDVLVVFHGNNFYTAAQLLTPTGTAGTWTQQALGDNGTNSAHMKIWTRKVTVDGAQTVTLAPAVDEEHSVFLFVISGADPTTWVDVAAGSNGASGTAHVAPTVDPTVQNALLLVGAQSTSLGNYTIPTALGMQKLAEVDVGGFCTSATGAEVLGNDSPTGTRTFTITAAGAYATVSIALKPVQDVVVAGPTTFPISVGGGVTPGGALANTGQKILAGAVTPAGGLSKSIGKPLAGGLAPSGALSTVRLRLLAVAGALTPTGLLVRQTIKPVTGSTSPTGALTKQVGKLPGGQVTPASVLTTIRLRIVALAGAITPSATMARQTNKPLTGSITPVGTPVKQTAKRPAGSVTPVGVVATVRARLLTVVGTVTPLGALARRTNKVPAGSVTPVGQLTRTDAKRLQATVTPVGALTVNRNRVVALAGAIASVGVVIRQARKISAGSVASAGAATKRISVLRDGSISPAGLVLKLLSRLLGGQVVPSGSLDTVATTPALGVPWPPLVDTIVARARYTADPPVVASSSADALTVTARYTADPPTVD